MSAYQMDSLFGGESRTTIAWGDYATSLSFDETFIIRKNPKMLAKVQKERDKCFSLSD